MRYNSTYNYTRISYYNIIIVMAIVAHRMNGVYRKSPLAAVHNGGGDNPPQQLLL